MIGRGIGAGFSIARDFIARGLIRLGVRPNGISMTGMCITFAAAVCYALGAGDAFAWSWRVGAGASAWPLTAAGMLILAMACDMLDGAVARLGDLKTTFGAFLDSTLDRYGDFVIYLGISVFYVLQSPANVTFMVLCWLAMFSAIMISYTRARAEDLINACQVGFWQRGERAAAILIATFAHNMPALLTQQAFSPMFTALRRIDYTRRKLGGKATVDDPRQGPWWMWIRLWRWPRMSWGYDLVVGVNIAWLIFAPVPTADPLRELIERLS